MRTPQGSRGPSAGPGPGGLVPAERPLPDVDARLAIAATVSWVVLLGALDQGAYRVLWAAGLALLTGSVAVVLAVRWHDDDLVTAPGTRVTRTGIANTAAMSALCCAIVLLALAADRHRIASGPVHAAAVQRLEGSFEATVSADPRPIGAGTIGGTRFVIDARLHRQRSGPSAQRVNVAVVVLANGERWSTLAPGQRIRFDGRSSPPEPSTLTAATIHARGSPTLLGRPPALQRLATEVRNSLRRACRNLPQPQRGLLPGLVDGDTSALDPGLRQQFRAAGLTHLVAVSGTNAAIVIGVLLLLLRRLRVPPWLSAVVAALCLVLFVAIARPSPSVLRAAVMAGVLLLSLATGRPRQGLPALSLAVLLLLAWHPDWARNAGFAMSALATAALLVVAPVWVRALRRRHVPAGIAEGVAIAASASLVSAPVIVLLSGQVSLVSLPANLLAEIAVAPATVLGVLAAISAPWSLGVGSAFAFAASVPCQWLVGVATFFGSLPGATVSWPSTPAGAAALVALTAVGLLLARSRRWRPLLLSALLTAVIVQIPVRSVTGNWPAAGSVLVVCDVGQGDALVLPMGAHAAVVVDSGPDPVAIDRCLRSTGITTVAVYIQSHFHLDHVGGIEGLIRGRKVGRVYVSPLSAPEQGHRLLMNALRPLGIAPEVAAQGMTIDAGPIHLEVMSSRIILVNDVGDPNESSLVVRATVGGHTLLLTGDASTEAQQDLLDSGQPLAAEILKVPHHGSAYFTPAFMKAVHPRLGIISVGAHNPYGHPALRLVDDLLGLGVSLRRTDEDGDVAVLAGPKGLGVQLHKTTATAQGPVPPRAGPRRRERSLSAVRATICAWPAPKILPTPFPADSCSSSVTRSSSSVGPSSRSPPTVVARIPRPRSSIGWALNSSPPSCTSC